MTDLQMIFQMRYSYFGQSGWRSPASKDQQLLFDPERLEKRAYYLEHIALASLAAQTDRDFKLVLLSSRGMPRRHKTFLREICADMLGPDRAEVIFRPPTRTAKCFVQHMRAQPGQAAYQLQTVLDDDDAVSSDFVAAMKTEARSAMTSFAAPEDYSFLSLARGLSAVFDGDRMTLWHRNSPFNNQGLTLLAPAGTRRSPFSVAHKKLARRHPARVIYGRKPFHIRAVHDSNDSKGLFGDRIVDDAEMAALIERFPLLERLREQHPGPVERLAA